MPACTRGKVALGVYLVAHAFVFQKQRLLYIYSGMCVCFFKTKGKKRKENKTHSNTITMCFQIAEQWRLPAATLPHSEKI